MILQPHPEGGAFAETWRAGSVDTAAGPRAAVTAIVYRLAPGESSAWHRVRSAELWLWQGGEELALSLGGSADAPVLDRVVTLGPELLQHVVEPGEWQAAKPVSSTVTCGCVVVPGFDFADFELEP